jgi:hypothetical protein
MAITSMALIGAVTVLTIGQGVQSLAGDKPAQRNAGDGISRPYQKIFTAPEPRKAVQIQAAPEIVMAEPNQQPRVVCGMVVVPVTPAVDPKMLAQTAKRDPNVDYKIRVIEPRICR